MAKARSPWRALRPALLAGAATLTWLTFSSPAASADARSDNQTLTGGVTSSVTSVTEELAGPAVNIVSAVPVGNQVTPTGAVTAVSAPIAGVADGATAAVVDSPVAVAVPVLEPVLQPVPDLVTGTVPLPVAVPDLPVPVDADTPEGATVVPTDDPAAAGDSGTITESPTPSGVPVFSAVEGPGLATSPVGTDALAGTASVRGVADATSGINAEQQDNAGPSPVHAQAPAYPGLGAGSGGSSSGSSGSTAWLSTFTFDLPIAGAVRAGEISEHVPAPVSYDPGSSPD